MKKTITRAKSKQPKPYAIPEKHRAYMLRTCRADMSGMHERSHHFVWPTSGPVSAPDWNEAPTCGGGLHGLLWGEGTAERLLWTPDAKWLVVEVDARAVVKITDSGDEKVKVPRGNVVCCGTQLEATMYLAERAPGHKVIGATITAGDSGTATAGVRGTATAGDSGTATAGYGGTATAGYGGTATAGYGGTATAGDSGTATAGYGGTATAGDSGEIRIRWWDEKANRYRSAIGYIGEGGLVAGRKYRCVAGQIVEAAA